MTGTILNGWERSYFIKSMEDLSLLIPLELGWENWLELSLLTILDRFDIVQPNNLDQIKNDVSYFTTSLRILNTFRSRNLNSTVPTTKNSTWGILMIVFTEGRVITVLITWEYTLRKPSWIKQNIYFHSKTSVLGRRDNKNILRMAQATTNQNSCLGYQNINSASKTDVNLMLNHRKVGRDTPDGVGHWGPPFVTTSVHGIALNSLSYGKCLSPLCYRY